jgi:hypothetical protein
MEQNTMIILAFAIGLYYLYSEKKLDSIIEWVKNNMLLVAIGLVAAYYYLYPMMEGFLSGRVEAQYFSAVQRAIVRNPGFNFSKHIVLAEINPNSGAIRDIIQNATNIIAPGLESPELVEQTYRAASEIVPDNVPVNPMIFTENGVAKTATMKLYGSKTNTTPIREIAFLSEEDIKTAGYLSGLTILDKGGLIGRNARLTLETLRRSPFHTYLFNMVGPMRSPAVKFVIMPITNKDSELLLGVFEVNRQSRELRYIESFKPSGNNDVSKFKLTQSISEKYPVANTIYLLPLVIN